MKNIVYVERGAFHPALFADELTADSLSWVDAPPPVRCTAKIRYRQQDQACTLALSNGEAHVRFDIPQRAISPGQSVVFYDGYVCRGGGIIRTVGPSYHEQKKELLNLQILS